MARRKRQQGPSPEELEAKADAILAQADRDMIKAMAENVQALCDGFAQLKLPSNDPEYLKTLQTSEARRNAIANQIATVHVVPDGGETWIGVSINNRRDHAAALEVARQMGEHFEAKVITHEA